MNQPSPRSAFAPRVLGLTPFIFVTLLALLLWGEAQGQAAAGNVNPQPASGATWYVDAAVVESGDGKTPDTAVRTIPEGLALAVAGDTVLVAAGMYTETALPGEDEWFQTLSITTAVSLVGAGVGESIIAGTRMDVTVILARDGRFEGFSLNGNVEVQGSGAAVLNNRIKAETTGVFVTCKTGADDCTAPVRVAFNVIDSISGDGILIRGRAVAIIRHNTVHIKEDNGWSGAAIWVEGPDATIEGNAIVGAVFGVYCYEVAPATLAHNNVEGSDVAYRNTCVLGADNTEYPSLLREPVGGDFRLTAGSPLRGRVPDGSDIGALPFVPTGQAPATVTVTALGGRQVQVDWADTGAAAYDLFVAGEEGVYTERHAVTGTTSTVITISSPLSNLVAVSSVSDDGDASELTAAHYIPPFLRDATVEQDSALVWSDGDWQTVADPNASGGSYLESTGDSAQVTIAFVGDTLVLGRRVGPGGGYGRVTVDGVDAGILSFDFPEERWRVPATLSGFGPGVHLFSLTPNWYQPETGSVLNLDFATAPSPFAPSAAQVQALERVNWHRAIAGLLPVRGVLALHRAAQAHSEYYAANRKDPRLAGLGFHQEQPDLPGFTGAWPSQRGLYFGYGYGAGEDGHFVGDPIESVDGWTASVYHRNLIMCYGCTGAGYGMVPRPNAVDTLNMGGVSPSPETRMIYTYPASGQTEVPDQWNGAEAPDPLPDKPRPFGYPISLYIAQPAQDGLTDAAATAPPVGDLSTEQESSPLWEVTTADLQTSDGVSVPVYLIEQNNDIPKHLGPDVVFLVPHKPLAKDTTYYAHIAGTDSRDEPFDYRWSFSTGGSVAAPNLAASQTWAEPLLPQAGDTITYHVRLVNSGLPAEGVSVRATMPQATQYVAGSAYTAQGSVNGEGPLEFAIGSMPAGSSVELRYSVQLLPSADLPGMVRSDVTIAWSTGQVFRAISTYAGASSALYLPAVAR